MEPIDLLKKRADTDPQGTTQAGLLGWYEVLLRRFKIVGTMVVLLPMYGLGTLCFGAALIPGVGLFRWGYGHLSHQPLFVQTFGIAFLVASAYLLFGFSLILIVPFVNFVLRTYPTPWRGPYYSLQTIRWAVHNTLTYFPRYTFLEFMTPTPFNILFYRLMGMKIGKNVQINTTHISDPCLIEIGSRTTIGGSATLLAHYGQGGYLVITPLKIGSNVTVGLKATIMGGVEIGDGAKILPNSVVLPRTKIPAGETWGGVPAQKIEIELKRKTAEG